MNETNVYEAIVWLVWHYCDGVLLILKIRIQLVTELKSCIVTASLFE